MISTESLGIYLTMYEMRLQINLDSLDQEVSEEIVRNVDGRFVPS